MVVIAYTTQVLLLRLNQLIVVKRTCDTNKGTRLVGELGLLCYQFRYQYKLENFLGKEAIVIGNSIEIIQTCQQIGNANLKISMNKHFLFSFQYEIV